MLLYNKTYHIEVKLKRVFFTNLFEFVKIDLRSFLFV